MSEVGAPDNTIHCNHRGTHLPNVISILFTAPLANATPLYAFQQSDLFGKLIVLVLLGASTLAWAIIVEKWLALRVTRRQMASGWKLLRSSANAEQILADRDSIGGVQHALLSAAVDAAARLRNQAPAAFDATLRGRGSLGPNPAEIDALKIAMEGEQLRQNELLEARLGLLSSIVSAAPFLGLLGTVWGVMMAFCGMAAQGKADINALAPGVSGALLTTVVALIVAIPALIGFNALASGVHRTIDESEQFIDELVGKMRTQSDAPEGHG